MVLWMALRESMIAIYYGKSVVVSASTVDHAMEEDGGLPPGKGRIKW